MTGPSACELTVADLAVTRALELAGKRLISRSQDRGPHWSRHTRWAVDPDRLDYLLGGAWDLMPLAAPDYTHLIPALDRYVRQLLLAGQAHDRRYLPAALAVSHA